MNEETKISRERMIEVLNQELARGYQAIIAYVIYSQTLKEVHYMEIAKELEAHAAEELGHAIQIARQINYFDGMPIATPKEVKISDEAEEMLRSDLEYERQTLINYRQRIRQADAMGNSRWAKPFGESSSRNRNICRTWPTPSASTRRRSKNNECLMFDRCLI